MATRYVKSTAAGANDGTSWTDAYTSLAAPTWVAGDEVFVSQAHAQSEAAALTIDLNGTIASPTKIICANDGATPPTAVASTGSVISSNNVLSVNDSGYIYGMTFEGSSNMLLNGVANHVQVYENCKLRMLAVSSTPRILTGVQGGATSPLTIFKNTQFKFAHASQRVQSSTGHLVIEGGSVESGSTALTASIFDCNSGSRPGSIEVSGFDFSNMGAACSLMQAAGGGNFKFIARNCKLPTSWTGSLATGTYAPGFRAEMHNCDNADTNYRLWVEDYAGSVKHETSKIRDGGASDGTTAYSWVMVSSANAEYPTVLLKSPEFSVWNDTTGASKTVTVEIALDSAGTALTDAECWLEVQYLGTSGFPISTFITDAKADYLATAANQATSSVTWNNMTTPTKQALSVTFTPQEKGYIQARVVLCKASTTLYVDPKLTVA